MSSEYLLNNGLESEWPTWLTHWGRDKMAVIFQTTLSNAFSWMKMYEVYLRFHWSLFLRFELTISQHWFRQWLGADQATSHYLNQWWIVNWCIYASLGLTYLSGWRQLTVVTFQDMSYDSAGYSISVQYITGRILKPDANEGNLEWRCQVKSIGIWNN